MLVGERIIVKDLAEDLYDGQVLQKLFGKRIEFAVDFLNSRWMDHLLLVSSQFTAVYLEWNRTVYSSVGKQWRL